MKLITRSDATTTEIVVLRTNGGHFAPLGKTSKITALCDRYYDAIKTMLDAMYEDRGQDVTSMDLWIVKITAGRWNKRSISIEAVPRKN